jgi:hypothetical protein
MGFGKLIFSLTTLSATQLASVNRFLLSLEDSIINPLILGISSELLPITLPTGLVGAGPLPLPGFLAILKHSTTAFNHSKFKKYFPKNNENPPQSRRIKKKIKRKTTGIIQ